MVVRGSLRSAIELTVGVGWVEVEVVERMLNHLEVRRVVEPLLLVGHLVRGGHLEVGGA